MSGQPGSQLEAPQSDPVTRPEKGKAPPRAPALEKATAPDTAAVLAPRSGEHARAAAGWSEQVWSRPWRDASTLPGSPDTPPAAAAARTTTATVTTPVARAAAGSLPWPQETKGKTPGGHAGGWGEASAVFRSCYSCLP